MDDNIMMRENKKVEGKSRKGNNIRNKSLVLKRIGNRKVYNKKRKSITSRVVDIQNTNVRDYLFLPSQGRSLKLLNIIYNSWKEKNFDNFFDVLNSDDFDHTCIENWLHKFSISLSKKYLKIKICGDHILVRNEYYEKENKTLKEYKITYSIINKCLKILINNIDKFCSYEITSILWAISIILIKSFKNSTYIGNNINVDNVKHNEMIINVIETFNIFLSLIINNLNKVKYNLSIDESLWAVWSICKLLYFNISFDNYYIKLKKRISSILNKDNKNELRASNELLNNVEDSLVMYKNNNENYDKVRNIKMIDKEFMLKDNKKDEENICYDNIYNNSSYTNYQISYMMKKFKLSSDDIKLYKNISYLKEKYYIYIPFIIFESQTLMLNNSILLLNKILYLILKNDVLLSLFSFDKIKETILPPVTKKVEDYEEKLLHYNKSKDIFRIKTLSKIYKLIKCISKIFYPLKNQNIYNIHLHNNYKYLNSSILIKFVQACNDVLIKYIDYFVYIIYGYKNIKSKDYSSKCNTYNEKDT
ncbi:hypothetical protein C923_03252, partial [Plasmodium falciparum UGT5.1]